MKKWKGTLTDATVEKVVPEDASSLLIQSYGITNMSEDPVTLNIKIKEDSTFTQILPLDLLLEVGHTVIGDFIPLANNESFVISVSGGTVDYYIIYQEL